MTRRSSPGSTATVSTPGPPHNPPRTADFTRRTAEDAEPEVMEQEEREAVLRGLGDERAGRLASDDEVEAAFRRFRP